MKGGVGFLEALLIFALIVAFVDTKQLPGLLQKSVRTVSRLRGEVRKFFDEIGK